MAAVRRPVFPWLRPWAAAVAVLAAVPPAVAGEAVAPPAAPAPAPASGTAPGPGAPPPLQGDPRRSGYAFMSAATQALQRDDVQNPALLWAQDGAQRYAADCARCHGDAAATGAAPAARAAAAPDLRGVAARYPAFDDALQRPLTLGRRIDACMQRHVGRPPLGAESDARLALEIHLGLQSRGRPLAPPADARMSPWRERGRALFERRLGQLGLSCAQCHDERAGARLGGSTIPQGHPTGYPIYRLEWQTVGSLQRRLRGCMAGVRAEPFAPDSDDFAALESYLMQRAAGMALETPAVRP